MPRLTTIQGIRICVYSNDHIPPHIHAIYNEHEALVDIRDVRIFEGSLPTNKIRVVFDYVGENQEDLLEVFYQLNPNIAQL